MARPAVVAAWAVGLGGVAHVAPGAAAWRRMRCRLLPTLAGVGEPGHVALTFDDGPDPVSTPAFLDELDRLGWKATFFLLGGHVRRERSLAAEVAARGHETAVHGDQHVSHLRRPWPWVADDLRRARDTIEDATGRSSRWVRPPYGALSASSLLAAKATGLRPVLWTTWGRDWRSDATPERVARDVTATWWPGPTVLLHDTDATAAPGSWRASLGALPILAEQWGAAGLRVGPLADHAIAAA